jgi:hypothetical protein
MQGEMNLDLSGQGKTATKFCLAFCLLSTLILVGFLVFGIFTQDVVSWAVVGALVSAPFLDLAVISSYWSNQRMQLISGGMWALTACILLAATLLLLRSGATDADLILTYGMAILSFPLGLIAGPLSSQLSMTSGSIQTVLIWLLAIGTGCLQWFLLVPALLNAVRRNRRAQ